MNGQEESSKGRNRRFGANGRRLFALWVAVASVIVLAGYAIFAVASRQMIDYQWRLLDVIASDRAQTISAWSRDRRDEALRFVQNPLYRAALERLSAGEQPGPSWAYLLRDINVLLGRRHYEAVIFLDSDNDIGRIFGEAAAVVEALPRLTLPESKQIVFREIAVGEEDSAQIRILMAAPVWNEGRYVGSLLFVIQPYLEVGPILTAWPWPQSSLELLVFRPLDRTIWYLTPLRDAPELLIIEKPVSQLLAAQTPDGRRLEGLDYRNVPSIGVVRAIPGTPWRLLAKIDRAELDAVVTNIALLAIALSLLLIGLAAGGAYFRLRQLQAQHRTAILQAEVEKQAMARHFDYLTKYANDVIILTNRGGTILEANDKALQVYGYTREQLLGRPIRDLVAPEALPLAERQWAMTLEQKAAIFEIVNIGANGERFPVESSLRVIDVEGRQYVQDIMRDIRERKKAEARILRLSRLYLTLSRTNEGIFRAGNSDEILRRACEIAVEQGEFVASWCMVVTSDGRYLEVRTFVGPEEEEFRQIIKPPLTEIAQGGLISTRAALIRRTVYSNDYLADPRIVVRDWARRNRVGSVAAMPIRFGEKLYGVFGVYTRPKNAFDREVIDLLERMADDIGYAIERVEKANALRESEERLALVFQATRDCYWDIDFERGTVYFSHIARKRFGLPDTPLTVQEAYDFFDRRINPQDLPTARAEFFAHLKGDTARVLSEYRMTMARGYERWIQVRGRVVRRDERGAPLRAAGTHTDITRRRKTEEQLKLWASVFSESRESILIADENHLVLSVNRAFQEISGYEPREIVGKDILATVPHPQDRAVYEKAWERARAGHWEGEFHARTKGGERIPLWTSITRIAGKGGQAARFVAISTDMREREAARERIRFLSYYDSLTGLPNRTLFRDRLQQAIARAKLHNAQLAVLFLDIDRFKTVNDSLGPAAGDQLLVELSRRLASKVSADETVARHGGDEFIALLTERTDAAALAQTAAELLKAVNEPFVIDGNEITMTASIGITVYPIDGRDGDTLIRNADAAMYYSKGRGRNNFEFFFSELNVRASRRLSLESRLRRSTETGAFRLYYQPQTDAFSGKPVAVEALIRWPQDETLVEPSEFIPLAEDTGLIVPIGEWVVGEACRQRQEWRAAGVGDIVVAINLSAAQFREKSVLERLRQLIYTHCDPCSMELELTESAIMEDAEESIRALQLLRESGIRLAVDDFGTGYSSLSYLRRFPLDRLKVDKSFVRDLPSDASDRAITQAIINMAKILSIVVIAEGVETREELELLRERSCDQIQGNLFSPPLPPAQLAEWWRRQQAAPAS